MNAASAKVWVGLWVGNAPIFQLVGLSGDCGREWRRESPLKDLSHAVLSRTKFPEKLSFVQPSGVTASRPVSGRLTPTCGLIWG